jgi:hypothetical protein
VAPDGKPFADVRVQLEFPANEAWSGPERLADGSDAQAQRRFQREVTTQADGSFELRGFPKGPVAVSLEDPRFLPFEQRLDAPTEKPPARLVVRFGGVIRVRAVDTDGLPATRRGVALYDLAPERGSGWEGSGTTDVEGLYHLRVKPGLHRVEVRPLRDYDSPDTVRSTVTVEEGETREVRVVVPCGDPGLPGRDTQLGGVGSSALEGWGTSWERRGRCIAGHRCRRARPSALDFTRSLP